MIMHTKIGAAFLFLFTLAAVPAVRAADLAGVEQLQTTLADVADRLRPSVVAIRAERVVDADDDSSREAMPDDEVHRRFKGRRYPAIGTGVIISPDGFILTNEHVIHNAEVDQIECVLHDGTTLVAQGLSSDPRSDLAVIKVDATGLQAARLGDVATVRQGHFAIVMGNPFGAASENSGRSAMSFGIISALGQDLTQKLDLSMQHYYGNLIQTDARINPGNSGGPLVNLRGEVIGITTAISTRSGSSEGVGYAISMDARIRQIVEQLMRGEEIEYGYLGVQLNQPEPQDRAEAGAPPRGGALVGTVTPSAPAAGKLQKGDIVVEYNHEPIDDVDELIRMVGASPVGKDVPVRVFREKKSLSLMVTPARKNVLRGVHVEAPLSWRGMRLADLSESLREKYSLPETARGVVVVRVDTDGAASRAGLKEGTFIQRIGEIEIEQLRTLRARLDSLKGPLRLRANDADTEITLPE